MSKWPLVRLGDVCEILDYMRVPVTATDRRAGIYPYYGANGVQDYVDSYIFDDELVLLAEDGGNFGSRDKPIAYRVSGKCWVNNHAHVLKPKQMLDVDYLCYSIMFYDVSKLISGTTRAKLNQAALRKMEIPLPALNVQKHIADTLDKTQEIIDGYKKQLAELDNLIKAIFYEMFGDPFDKMDTQTKIPLSNVTDIVMGQSPRGDSYNNEGFGTPLLNGPTEFGEISPNEKQWTNEPTKLCSKDDILFCVRGATAGRMNIADKQYCIGRGLAAIRAKDTEAREYIYSYLELMYDYFQSTSNGSTFINISKNQLENMPIIYPSKEGKFRFSKIATKIEEHKAIVKQAITESENLFNSLMRECFD